MDFIQFNHYTFKFDYLTPHVVIIFTQINSFNASLAFIHDYFLGATSQKFSVISCEWAHRKTYRYFRSFRLASTEHKNAARFLAMTSNTDFNGRDTNRVYNFQVVESDATVTRLFKTKNYDILPLFTVLQRCYTILNFPWFEN